MCWGDNFNLIFHDRYVKTGFKSLIRRSFILEGIMCRPVLVLTSYKDDFCSTAYGLSISILYWHAEYSFSFKLYPHTYLYTSLRAQSVKLTAHKSSFYAGRHKFVSDFTRYFFQSRSPQNVSVCSRIMPSSRPLGLWVK